MLRHSMDPNQKTGGENRLVASEEKQKIRAAKWAVLGQDRSLPHNLRRLYHLVLGIACVLAYAYFMDRKTCYWAIIYIGGPFIVLDILRQQSPLLKRLALKHFSPVMRRNELLGLSGNSYFILGLFAVVFFFPKSVALLSILYLAIGDPVAAWVGTNFGKIRLLGKKTLEGALANFLVSVIATIVFAHWYLHLKGSDAWMLSVLGGLASVIAELIPLPVDDNFSVPVLAALQLSLIHFFFPVF